MLPPAEGKGMQIHFGPSDYTDPVEVAKYVLSPGQEVNTFAIAKFPADQERWFNHVKIQMRPGSHHVVDSLVRGDFPEGLVEDVQCPGDKVAGFPGTQTLVTDSPPSGVPAPENVGMGQKIPGDVSMCVNHHGYNLQGDEGTLRELWINLWFVEPDAVTQEVKGVFLSAGPYKGIPPQSKQVLTYTADVPGDGRIVSLLGHRHAYTERFLVKVNDGIVYDSWSWQEAVTFNYDSLTSNPPVRPEAKSDGATSGILSVKKGDRITIECDVNNTSNNTLTFKNQLYGGEMCLLFGGAVGTEIVSAF
jgi:hypothetical protein